MEWISIKDHLPTEDGDYLVTIKIFGKYKSMKVVHWANDLYKVDSSDFYDKQNVGGFYSSGLDFDLYEVTNVLAWCKVESYEGE